LFVGFIFEHLLGPEVVEELDSLQKGFESALSAFSPNQVLWHVDDSVSFFSRIFGVPPNSLIIIVFLSLIGIGCLANRHPSRDFRKRARLCRNYVYSRVAIRIAIDHRQHKGQGRILGGGVLCSHIRDRVYVIILMAYLFGSDDWRRIIWPACRNGGHLPGWISYRLNSLSLYSKGQ
jgi:hypothetical protein